VKRRKNRKTTDAWQMLEHRLGDDQELWNMVDEERLNLQIAQAIYQARTKAGVTQKQLAEKAGTAQPNIARLEDADYQGHSLPMLRRVARALGLRLELRFARRSGRGRKN